MSVLDFNANNTRFTFEGGQDFEYKKLEELYLDNGKEEVYKVNALYINDSKFGRQPLAITDNENVNLPMFLVDTVEEIRRNESIVEDINNGKVGFTIYQYVNTKYDKLGYGVNWVEING